MSVTSNVDPEVSPFRYGLPEGTERWTAVKSGTGDATAGNHIFKIRFGDSTQKWQKWVVITNIAIMVNTALTGPNFGTELEGSDWEDHLTVGVPHIYTEMAFDGLQTGGSWFGSSLIGRVAKGSDGGYLCKCDNIDAATYKIYAAGIYTDESAMARYGVRA